jgi:hypothetical protein
MSIERGMPLRQGAGVAVGAACVVLGVAFVADAQNLYVDGKIGVGTTAPVYKLHLNDTSHLYIQMDSAAGMDCALIVSGDGRTGWIAGQQSNGLADRKDFSWYNYGTQGVSMVIDWQTGNVGMGTVSPSHPLHMGSGAHVTTGGVWTNASSIATKYNVIPLSATAALNAVKALVPVTYNSWAEAEYWSELDAVDPLIDVVPPPAETYVGFVGEDVPELVAMNDRAGMSPMDIAAVLTKVVQEQQKEINALKADVAALKAK